MRGETLFGCLLVDNIILLDYVIKNGGYHDFFARKGDGGRGLDMAGII